MCVIISAHERVHEVGVTLLLCLENGLTSLVEVANSPRIQYQISTYCFPLQVFLS